jgi:hypothetical protein
MKFNLNIKSNDNILENKKNHVHDENPFLNQNNA